MRFLEERDECLEKSGCYIAERLHTRFRILFGPRQNAPVPREQQDEQACKQEK